MKNNLKETIVGAVLLVLAVLLLNPLNFWMPDMMLVGMLGLTLGAFALFAGFVLREKVQDERELAHRMLAGRVAFLVGSALLTLGIVVQATRHEVDPWLVIALVAMVLSKLVVRIYSDSKM